VALACPIAPPSAEEVPASNKLDYIYIYIYHILELISIKWSNNAPELHFIGTDGRRKRI
jgi:hypothetical protein